MLSSPYVRVVLTFAIGVLLIGMMATIASQISLHPFVPNVMLPIVIFLGVSSEVSQARGALTAFLLGYLLDVSGGNSIGLQTFTCVATYLTTRAAGLRLFSRNIGLQMFVVFMLTVLAGALTLALRAIFTEQRAFAIEGASMIATTVVGTALATALLSPVIVASVRWIEGTTTERREEPTA